MGGLPDSPRDAAAAIEGDVVSTIDGRWLTESVRLKLLADEEHEALGLEVEYRSNAVTKMHPATTAMVHTLPGEAEKQPSPPPSAAARPAPQALDRISADEGCFPAGAAEAL